MLKRGCDVGGKKGSSKIEFRIKGFLQMTMSDTPCRKKKMICKDLMLILIKDDEYVHLFGHLVPVLAISFTVLWCFCDSIQFQTKKQSQLLSLVCHIAKGCM